jgi:hypothetical protein
MECDPDGRCGAQVVYGHERVGEAGVASLHRGVWGRLPPARAGHGLDWGGGRQGEPLLDVVGLLLVFFLITLFNLPLVFLYACLEVWLDAKEVYAFDWLWW